jgi:hypothetical protein
MELRAKELQCQAKSLGYFCLVSLVRNDEYGLFLVPISGGILYVIQNFCYPHGNLEVGNEIILFREILAIDKINPLIPFVADSLGLKVKFSRPINRTLMVYLYEAVHIWGAMVCPAPKDNIDFIKKNMQINLLCV